MADDSNESSDSGRTGISSMLINDLIETLTILELDELVIVTQNHSYLLYSFL